MGLPALRPEVLGPARRALAEGTELPAALRDTIRSSWIRSRLAAAPLDRIDVPYQAVNGRAERLVRAAEPILDRFAGQLTDTNVSIVLADSTARVVGRWAGDRSALRRLARLSIDEGFVLAEDLAGTNGVGTVLEELRPVTIVGDEHYSEPLRRLVCVGAPIRNPLTRRIEGVLDLACPVPEATGLLIPTLLDLSLQIEQELSARASVRERLVFDTFVARSRETSAALVGLGEQYMVTNAAAADLLETRDQRLLWEQVAQAGPSPRTIRLAGGTLIDARCQHIRIGSLLAGALIELVPATADGSTAGSAAVRPGRRVVTDELTDLVRRAPRRIGVVGEAGTGKLTTAKRIHELMHPDATLTVHPVGLAQVDGPRTWLAELRTRLADSRGTVVLRHVELLDDVLARSLAELLDQHHGTGPLVIAVRTAAHGTEPDALHGRFGDAVLHLPALRERRDELDDLVRTVLRSAGCPAQVGHRAMAALVNYGWPGNFLQLEQVVRAAARRAAGAPITLDHLPDEIGGSMRTRRRLSRLEVLERQAILDALRESGGNRARAAVAVGISRSTLYRRMRVLELDTHRVL